MTIDMRHAEFDVLSDVDAVAMRMAELFIQTVQSRPGKRIRIALSGGSTPKRLFAILAQPEMVAKIDWKRVELFYGDERHVPVGHADSNHTVAQELLLSKVPLPASHIHAMPTDGQATSDAQKYQRLMEASYGSSELKKGEPFFDLVMLGLGTDGHTASLFPGEAVLEERKAWVSVATPKTAPYERLTLTYPAIASSRQIVFLVTGANKVPMYERLHKGDSSIPSGRIVSEGKILVLADREAAGG